MSEFVYFLIYYYTSNKKLNMKQYRHKKTGKVVMKGRDSYFEINPNCNVQFKSDLIPEWVVEDSCDWEPIREQWELKIKECNKEIYFKNTVTEVEFHIGDYITIKDQNHSFGDGVRNHTISGFTFEWKNKKDSLFELVHASFVGYNPFDRVLRLDDMERISCK
jgi:hypothetical protein